MADYTRSEQVIMPSFIHSRIDTQPMIDMIREYLSGQRTIQRPDQNGMIQEVVIQISEPRANSVGITSICQMIQMRVNSHTVQGNFTRDDFENYKYYARISIATEIVIMCHKWGVDPSNIDGMIDTIMDLIVPFMSRLINNKERESYNQVESREMITGPAQNSGILGFGKK